jgi:hypothetical protein
VLASASVLAVGVVAVLAVVAFRAGAALVAAGVTLVSDEPTAFVGCPAGAPFLAGVLFAVVFFVGVLSAGAALSAVVFRASVACAASTSPSGAAVPVVAFFTAFFAAVPLFVGAFFAGALLRVCPVAGAGGPTSAAPGARTVAGPAPPGTCAVGGSAALRLPGSVVSAAGTSARTPCALPPAVAGSAPSLCGTSL